MLENRKSQQRQNVHPLPDHGLFEKTNELLGIVIDPAFQTEIQQGRTQKKPVETGAHQSWPKQKAFYQAIQDKGSLLGSGQHEIRDSHSHEYERGVQIQSSTEGIEWASL